MIKINLVPQQILDREQQKLRSTQVAVAAGALGLFVLAVSILHYRTSVRLAESLKKNQSELDRLQTIVAKVEELEHSAQAVRARLNVMQDLLVGRPLYPKFMESLLSTFPSGVWISNLTTASEGSGLKVTMTAKSLTSEDVAQWLRTLDKSDFFKDPVIGVISIDATDRTNSFTMATKYTPVEVKR